MEKKPVTTPNMTDVIFDPDTVACPKCGLRNLDADKGDNLDILYVPAEEIAIPGTDATHERAECMRITCGRCDYVWCEVPADYCEDCDE